VISFLEEKNIFKLVKVHHFCEEKERKKKRKKLMASVFGVRNFAKMKKN
jgi:hypothetical protein